MYSPSIRATLMNPAKSSHAGKARTQIPLETRETLVTMRELTQGKSTSQPRTTRPTVFDMPGKECHFKRFPPFLLMIFN